MARKKRQCTWTKDNGYQCTEPGEGNPPLCAEHEEALLDEPTFVEALMDHPSVGSFFDQLTGRLNQTVDPMLGRFEHYVDQRAGAASPPPPKGRRGAAAPPPPPQPPPGGMSVQEARSILGFSEQDALIVAVIKKRKRELAERLHPDKGGSPRLMAQVNAAATVLLRVAG
jgi:hypothetical protein